MTASVDKQLGRRKALVGIGAAAAATVIPVAVGAQQTERPSEAEPAPDHREAAPDTLAAHRLTEAGDDVRALFGELATGQRLVQWRGGRWRLEALYDVRAGGIPLVLSMRSGHRFAVEVFRTEAGAQPLATAGPMALYLINRGDGASATDEAAGLGVIALGGALRARLQRGARVPETLTTMSERRRSHPTGVFHVPVGATG